MEEAGMWNMESSADVYVESDEVQSIEEEQFESDTDGTNVSIQGDRASCLNFKGKPYEDLEAADMIGVEFGSVNEVDSFYSFYSLAMGFSFRKQKLDKEAGTVVRRQLVCSKEGIRKKKSRLEEQISASCLPTSRKRPSKASFMQSVGICGKGKAPIGDGMQAHDNWAGHGNNINGPRSHRITRRHCSARLTVRLCKKTGKFRVVEFITQHNHALAPTELKSFLRSHRNVSDHALAQVTSLRKVSVTTSRAYELLVHQAGGHEFVGFTMKDLQNKVDEARKEMYIDGDGQATISFMNLKASKDPGFYCLFSVDVEGKLCNMFWRDTVSMLDYNSFGDVLILDSTYKTNIYGKPLAVFVGVNNHRATVLFGCALLVDETEDTYNWVLTAFLDSMNGKRPISVITDGDEAMRNAVNRLVPEARHRLCAWHIAKNVVKNVGNVDVQRDFCHLIFAGLSVEDWEKSWHYMVALHGLQDNRWLSSMYSKRDRWAEAFFRSHFFGGICTTQRCEAMHRNIKTGVGKFMRLCEFLPRMDKTLARMRYNHLYDDFKSMNSDPIIGSHMRCMQEQVGAKFTHDIFLLIKDQIMFESKFVVADHLDYHNGSSTLFLVTQYGKAERTWHVTYLHGRQCISFKCSCQLFESDGIPCCHIFTVMKTKLLTKFPDTLVTHRWTKEASPKKTHLIRRSGNISSVDIQLARYGQMMSDCSRICHLASFSDDAYEETFEAFSRLMVRSQNWHVAQHDTSVPIDGLHPNVIRDPAPCRTKGAQTRTANIPNDVEEPSARGCGFCTRPGHNIRTCPLRKEADVNCDAHNATNHAANSNVAEHERGGHSSVYASPGPIGSVGVGHSASALRSNRSAFAPSFQNDEESAFLPPSSIQHMIHHVEEARTFDFFSGHDNILSFVLGGNGNLRMEDQSISSNQPGPSHNTGGPNPFVHQWFH
ncbi:protein FAR1-RELATED SEQUENCE 5-like [Rosa rugosa]|uniref:protein FAR1-RELATED SEQUENCE 5-like n=1 Tax=Rosa rugosa TaxID=74645 RepID=UPI002B40F074|nr:protein FAR1-RELATED SEQUENCE 5-like [Rosa rugosa]XP_062021249.1 protein FAR1-RELATED SEQUENCE 5-like [Rosa rugosa]